MEFKKHGTGFAFVREVRKPDELESTNAISKKEKLIDLVKLCQFKICKKPFVISIIKHADDVYFIEPKLELELEMIIE